jgi:hypothetical protein
MVSKLQQVEAVVFKQFTLKWQEVGKSAVMAGITAALTLIGASITAGEFPTSVELISAAKVGGLTMIGAIIRYVLNPTTTVIKGQIDPVSKVLPKTDTVVTVETDGLK